MPAEYNHDPVSRRGSGPFRIHQEESLDSRSESGHSSKVRPGATMSITASTEPQQGAAMDTRLPMTTSRLVNQQGRLVDRDSMLKKQSLQSASDSNESSSNAGRQAPSQQPSHQVVATPGQPVHGGMIKPSLIPSSVNTSAGQVFNTRRGLDKASSNAANDENTRVTDLQKELQDAKEQIAGLHQQLSQQQITQQTVDQVLASPEPVTLQVHGDPEEVLRRLRLSDEIHPREAAVIERTGVSQPFDPPSNPWDDTQISTMGRASNSQAGWGSQAAWNGQPGHAHHSSQQMSHNNVAIGRNVPGLILTSHVQRGWNGSLAPSAPSTASYTPPLTPLEHMSASNAAQWQPRPAAAPFAPVGAELSTPWNSYPPQYNQSPQQYLPPTEPINYRRLLDRNVSCSWKYIVDKIICSNDQQASIFLQQKLKVSPPELKVELVDAIIDQAYPLMVNRFGNFLIQRCLEHGSPEQVSAIANTIRGKTLELSMDAFGCHVVQKALDVVPETYKASMVHELLRQIPQTVVHRYACHVWQKLFELRWKDSPPQIMRFVNEALRGMWHEVALGETGSLVVQNIFENCLDEDKRPSITEVLQQIDVVAHGQFGNWCIQHICEHGAPADKSRAVEHVLHNATSYSTDQFASKVVEKCLKVGGADFLERYLAKVCEARPDRPRMPLIDIAGDQYGNYLVQHILVNADNNHRETVAQHIRKHMVSLRGSKFGSRVALLCCNPNITTRPGPAVPFNDRFYPSFGGAMGRGSLPGSCR